jgi:hypothetical protein
MINFEELEDQYGSAPERAKFHETERSREHRNIKGRGGSARKRQMQKTYKRLAKELKDER